MERNLERNLEQGLYSKGNKKEIWAPNWGGRRAGRIL